MADNQCAGCGGCTQCGGCSGCGSIALTQSQLDVLARFAVMPFYPAGYMLPDDAPVCLDFCTPEEMQALQSLIAQRLISSDPYETVAGADLSGYRSFQLHGSVALTRRGQQVIEQLDMQGLDDE